MRIFSLILLSFLLSGCAQWKASARINPQSVAEYSSPARDKDAFSHDNYKCGLTAGPYDSQTGAVNLDCFKFPEDRAEAEQQTAYTRAAGKSLVDDPRDVATRQAEAKVARDRLAGVLLKHADDICVVEKGRLLATQTSANFGLSFLTTALSTASTIVGGEQAKSILSGLAAVTSSTQDNVNATFYQNQLTQAITKSIDGERKTLLTAITASRASSTEDYSVDDMVRAVNQYHQACSFEKGLQLLLEAATDSNGANAAQEFRATQATIVRLRNYISEKQKAIASNEKLGVDVTELKKQLLEAEGKLHGLQMAGAAVDPKGESPIEAETPDLTIKPPGT